MTLSPFLIAAIAIAALALLAFLIHRAFPSLTLKAAVADAKADVTKAESAVIALGSNLEAYTHAELVKLVGLIMDHIADTSTAQAQIKGGQTAMATQAQFLAAIQARVASAHISAAG